MRNKKGFTLIELLAIIVILAVIMVIAVPQILDVVNGSKNSAWKNNVNMIERSITKNIGLVDPETGFRKYTIDGLCNDTSKLREIVKADDTSITCSSNVFTLTGTGQFTGYGATITCTNNKCSVNISDSNQVELAAGLYDNSNNLIASWDSLINDYGIDLNYSSKHVKSYEFLSGYYNQNIDYHGSELNNGGWIEWDENNSMSYSLTHPEQNTNIGVEINNYESSQPGVVLSKGDLASGTKLVIPGTLKTIPDGAFQSAIYLKEVVINSGVEKIDDHAFKHLVSLEKITIADSVRQIGWNTFTDCINLTNIKLPNNLTVLDAYTFYGCISLKKIIIPSSVIEIGMNVCECCDELEEISELTNVTKIDSNAFLGCSKLKNATFSNKLIEIGSGAFASTGLTSVTIPSSVNFIGDGAFSSSNITSAVFENPNGWSVSGESISSTDLANPTVAASYLNGSAGDYDWDWVRE